MKKNRDSQRDNNKSKHHNETKAFLCHVSESVLKLEQKDSWFADSGATDYTCNQREWFQDYYDLQQYVPMTIGDGSIMYGIGRGNIKVLSYTGEQWIQ